MRSILQGLCLGHFMINNNHDVSVLVVIVIVLRWVLWGKALIHLMSSAILYTGRMSCILLAILHGKKLFSACKSYVVVVVCCML